MKLHKGAGGINGTCLSKHFHLLLKERGVSKNTVFPVEEPLIWLLKAGNSSNKFEAKRPRRFL